MRRTSVSSVVLGAATAVLLVFGTAAGCNTNGPGGAGGGTGGAADNGNGSDKSLQNEAPASGLPTSAPTPSGGGQQPPLGTSTSPAAGGG